MTEEFPAEIVGVGLLPGRVRSRGRGGRLVGKGMAWRGVPGLVPAELVLCTEPGECVGAVAGCVLPEPESSPAAFCGLPSWGGGIVGWLRRCNTVSIGDEMLRAGD